MIPVARNVPTTFSVPTYEILNPSILTAGARAFKYWPPLVIPSLVVVIPEAAEGINQLTFPLFGILLLSFAIMPGKLWKTSVGF